MDNLIKRPMHFAGAFNMDENSLRSRGQNSIEFGNMGDELETWSPSDFNNEEFYEAYLNFKDILVNDLNINPEENISTEELFRVIFDNYDRFSDNEVIGLSLFLSNFQLMYNNDQNNDDESGIIELIFEKAMFMLENTIENQNVAAFYFTLELMELIGPYDVVEDNVEQFITLLGQINYIPILIKLINIIIVQGTKGLTELINVLETYPIEQRQLICQAFSHNLKVIVEIIIPTLLSDLESKQSPTKRKNQILAILCRLGYLIDQEKILLILGELQVSGIGEPILVASCILAAGVDGAHLLQLLMKSELKPNVIALICMLFRIKIEEEPLPVLKRRVVKGGKGVGGSVWGFKGDIAPHGYGNEEIEEPVLILYEQNFENIIKRYLKLSITKTRNSQKEVSNLIWPKYLTCVAIQNRGNEGEKQMPEVNKEILHTLAEFCSHPDKGVRESSQNSLGLIGMPYLSEIEETVINSLKDKEANVRAMAAWCVGKISSSNLKIFNLLLPLLDDTHLQVRTSACISIGGVTNKNIGILMEKLKKSQKDGSVNREVTCETILRLKEGDMVQIELMLENTSDPIILKAIVKVFKNLDINSPTTDFALDEIVNISNHDNRNVRMACAETLATLIKLKNKDPSYQYEKKNNYENFKATFFKFLKDDYKQIRDVARESLIEWGVRAKLLFIEGLRKESNHNIQIECAKGLMRFGPSGFRAVLMAMINKDEKVSKAIGDEVHENFNIQELAEWFSMYPKDYGSVQIMVEKLLLEQNFMSNELETFLKAVLTIGDVIV